MSSQSLLHGLIDANEPQQRLPADTERTAEEQTGTDALFTSIQMPADDDGDDGTFFSFVYLTT